METPKKKKNFQGIKRSDRKITYTEEGRVGAIGWWLEGGTKDTVYI